MLKMYACLGSISYCSLITVLLLCLGLYTKTHFARVRKQKIMVLFQKTFWLPQKKGLKIFSRFLKKTLFFVTTDQTEMNPQNWATVASSSALMFELTSPSSPAVKVSWAYDMNVICHIWHKCQP